MKIQYPTRLIRSVLSVSISVALVGCTTIPTNVGSSRFNDSTYVNSGERQSNLDRARAEFSRGNYGNAIVLLEAELSRRPTSVAALNGLGACYDQLGRYEVAQRYYYRALDMAPESSTTLSNIGYSYMKEGRHEEALQILELALQRDADNKTAASNLAMVKTKILENSLESAIVSKSGSEAGAIAATNSTSNTSTANQASGRAQTDISLTDLFSSAKNSPQVIDENDKVSVPSEVNPTVVNPIVVNIATLSSLPSLALLTSAIDVPSNVSESGLSQSAPVPPPTTKIAMPVPARSLQPIASAQANVTLTESLISAPAIPEPAAVVIVQNPIIEKNLIPTPELPQLLSSSVAGASEIRNSAASQSGTVPPPATKIAALDPLPAPAAEQQPFELTSAASEMRDMAPSPLVSPLPLPAEVALEQTPTVDEISDPAMMSPPPQIVATEHRSGSKEIVLEGPGSLVLTVLDMNTIPGLTLRILESEEPTPAEASDYQLPLPEPVSDEAGSNQELPQIADEQVPDLEGTPQQAQVEPAREITEPPVGIQNSPQFAVEQGVDTEDLSSKKTSIEETRADSEPAPVFSQPLKLAVVNGNGLLGIARATSTWLDDEQVKITNVADAENFNYSQTVIKHRPEFAQFAMEMAAQMAVNCDIQVTDDLLDGVDMQLILGQDFASNVQIKDGWLSFNNEQVTEFKSELRLEISNGNGVLGMAARMRSFLRDKGSSVVRLTNANRFNYSESTLFYRPGTRAAAEELILALPVQNVSLQETSNLAATVDARLLLGGDFVPYDIGSGEI